MPAMVREAWTDERLDDLANHMDEGFREVRADLRQQRGEMARQKDMEARFEAQQKHMDARFDDLNRTMQIGFSVIGGALAVIGAVLVGLIGLIGTQL
jgi:hypothetical protein